MEPADGAAPDNATEQFVVAPPIIVAGAQVTEETAGRLEVPAYP
jgi:hypothetical protein